MFVPILAYHKVQNEFELGASYTTPRQFERQIKFLYENGFKSISLEEYVQNNNHGPRDVIITFDDAYASVFENAFPILRQYDFTATIFVITKYVGDWNSWDYHGNRFRFEHCTWQQIEILAKEGWEIGSHTVSHPNLRSLSLKTLWFELRYSKDVLENQLNQPIKVMSYPFGSFNSNVIGLVKKAGYEAACTLGCNYPYDQIFPYALFRRGVYRFEPFWVFKTKLTNNYWSHCDDIKQKLISGLAQSTLFLRLLRTSIKTT
ncbi:MAG: polysaccharide deacetylase family protein [bacterium]